MARRRPKGTGAVRKLPSGRWQARIDNGAGVLVSLGSYATKTDATHALSVAARRPSPRRWTDPTAGRLTLASTPTSGCSTARRIAARTAELYDSLLRNHILPDLRRRRPCRHLDAAVRQWHSRMLPAGAPGTRHRRQVLPAAAEPPRHRRRRRPHRQQPVRHQGSRRRAQPGAPGRHDPRGVRPRRRGRSPLPDADPARHLRLDAVRRARRPHPIRHRPRAPD